MAGAVTAGALVISMSADVATLKTNMSEGMRAVETSSKKMADDIAGIRKGFEDALAPLQQLSVKVGSLESNMAKAQSAALSLAKGLIIGAAAGMSIDAIKSKIFGVIDSMATLKTVSEKTGSSVENLSKLGFVAKQSGSDLDSVAGALAKMSKGMAGADNETKGAGLAMSFLGIKAKDAAGNLKDPSAMFTEVAKKLVDYEDGAGKAAIAMALFGKTGADMLPTLKMLGEQGDIAAKATDAQATAARQYQRDIAKLDAQKGMLFKTIALALLPAMSDFAGAMIDASKNVNLTNQAVKGLADDNSISGWADDAAIGVARLVDVIMIIPGLLSAVGGSFKVVAADIQFMAAAASIANPVNAAIMIAKGGNPNEELKKLLAERNKVLDDSNKKLDDLWSKPGNKMESAIMGRIAGRNTSSEDSADAVGAMMMGGAGKKKKLNYSTAGEDGGDGSAEKKAALVAKEATAYATLSAAIREKIIASGVEASGAKPLNEAQKLQVVLDQQLLAGKLKLSPAHIAAYEQDIKQLDINLALVNSHKSVAAAMQVLDDGRNSAYQSTLAEAQANEGLVAVFGLSKSAIEAQSLARAEDRLAQRGALELDDKEVAQLERVIAARKRNVAALGGLEMLEAEKKFNLDRIADQKKTVEKYDDVFRLGFSDMVNGGKDTWKSFTTSLTTTFKTTVADQIYKTFAQPFVVRFVASMMGITGAGMAGAVQADGSIGVAGSTGSSGIGGAASLLQTGKGAYDAITTGFAGIGQSVSTGVQSGIDAMYGTSGVMGPTAAGGNIAMGGSTAAYAGTAATYAAGMAAGKMFGSAISGQYSIGDHGSAVVNVATIAGAFLGGPIGAAIGGALGGLANRLFGMGSKDVTSAGVSGSIGASGFSGKTYSNWHQDGGYFRSDDSGTDPGVVDPAMAQGFTDGYKALQVASSGFAKALGVDASAIAARTQALDIVLTSDAAENTAAITKFFVGVGDAMANELVPSLAAFTKSGEIASATLQRIAGDYQAVDAVLATLSKDSVGAFGAVGIASVAMREQLVTAAGSIAALTSGTIYFAQNFLSAAEQIAPITKNVTGQLAAMGLASVTTNDQFKQVVLGLDLSTQAGADQYAAMLLLAPQFKQMTDYTTALINVDVAAAKSTLKTAYDAESSALQGAIDKTKTFAATLKTYRDGLSLGSMSTLTPLQKYAESQSQYAVTLAKAQAGSTTAQDALTGAASAFLDASRVVNASDAQYTSDYARVMQQTADMAQLAATQIDVGQASLDALNLQVSGMLTLNASTLSVFAAVNALTVAMGGKPAVDGSHAAGLASVPFDGYRAELHRGEGVIDAPAMAAMRRYFGGSPSTGGGNTDALVVEIKGLRAEVTMLRAEQKEQTVAVIASTHAAHDNSANKVVAGTISAAKAAAHAAKKPIKLA